MVTKSSNWTTASAQNEIALWLPAGGPLPEYATSGSRLQRKSGFLKVFRCGALRDDCRQVMMACVDKPRKEEAAGVWDQPMGKVR
jgi:hypothetical protein